MFSNIFSAAVVINNYLRMIIFRSWFKTTCESIAEKKSGPWQKNLKLKADICASFKFMGKIHEDVETLVTQPVLTGFWDDFIFRNNIFYVSDGAFTK